MQLKNIKIKALLILLVLFVGQGMLVSCNDWLEVKSNEVLLQEEVFGDGSGVRIAVNGVYREISKTPLYGESLTWGLASVLAHHYVTDSYYLPNEWIYASRFDWGNSSVLPLTEAIWGQAYYVIANCNNIIQEVSKKDGDFFIRGQKEKDMILGEMHGIRALLHFEMLRLFAPVPKAGAANSDLAIPYVTAYPAYQPVRLNVDDVMENIIRDMEESRKLLAPLDTIDFVGWIGLNYRFKGNLGVGSAGDEFLAYRCTRMNYWAATALLARINLWNGDKKKAYDLAQGLYTHNKARNFFTWTAASNQSNSNLDNIHPKRYSEIFLGFYNIANLDNYEAVVNAGYSYYPRFSMKNMDVLFAGETDDYRFTNGFYRNRVYWVWKRPEGTSYNATLVATIQGAIQPLIRLSEIHYIMIEYLIEAGRYAEAKSLLSEVQTARGVKLQTIPDDNTDNRLMEKLVNDMIREGLTEGQVFFMYKRLNRNIFNGATEIPMTAEKFIPEYPSTETMYVL